MNLRTFTLSVAMLIGASAASPSADPRQVTSSRAAFQRLARANDAGREKLRMAYAAALVRERRGEEARGVLAAVARGNPTFRESQPFKFLAAHAALDASRPEEALTALQGLVATPESCRLTVLAAEQVGRMEVGKSAVDCAMQGLPQLDAPQREVTLIAAARIEAGQGLSRRALGLLGSIRSLRPDAMLAMGDIKEAGGDPTGALAAYHLAAIGHGPVRLRAQIGIVASELVLRRVTPRQALARLDRHRFDWRGGSAEKGLLTSMFDMAEKTGRADDALRAGATLLRYLDPGVGALVVQQRMRALLGAALLPAGRLSLIAASDLFWSYRDFAPNDETGNALMRDLSDRLRNAGLVGKAADLRRHLALYRSDEAARPLLGAQAAAWYLMDNRPDRASDVLAATRALLNAPLDVQHLREALDIAASIAGGRVPEAVALLENGTTLPPRFLAEAWWRSGDRRRFAAAMQPIEAGLDPRMAADGELMVRLAVAYAELDNQVALAALARRFPENAALNMGGDAVRMLAISAKEIDSSIVKRAMTGLPNARRGDVLLAEAFGCRGALGPDLRCLSG